MDALVVEDQVAIGRVLVWALRRIAPGWDIQITGDAIAGGYLLVLDPSLKMAVVDYFMPMKLGDEIIEEALKIRPHLKGKIIVCSGIGTYPPEVEKKLFVELGCRRLDKPIDLDKFEEMVLEIIGPR